MLWLRKGIVHVLAVLLLLTLLVGAEAASFNANFAHPDKLEGWLASSHIYDHIISNSLDKAQATGQQDGNASSVSLNDPSVRQAASEAFSPQFLQQSVNTFLNSNYAWLQNKTPTPEFTIDVTGEKQDFAKRVGLLVQNHLATLPICTAQQLAQLQIPVDPLSVTCRPGSLDPKTEGARVTQEVSTSDFLNKPVLTAQSLSPSGDNSGKPYYEKLSRAPKLYRLGMQMPLICTGLAVLLILGIVVIAPTRRKGLLRTGIMFLEAGIILIAIKFVADAAVKHFEGRVLTQTFSGQLQQPYNTLLHKIEAGLVQTDLYFGIAFMVIAVLLLGYLLMSRQRSPKAPKPPKAAPAGSPQPSTADLVADDSGQSSPAVNPATVQLAPSAGRRAPSMDVMAPKPKPQTPPSAGPAGPAGTPAQKPPRPRRPRLIQ